MTISKSKKAVLHVAKAKLDMADEAYRALLMRVGGVASSVNLDEQGFDHVMAEFARLGFIAKGSLNRLTDSSDGMPDRTEPSLRSTYGARNGMATTAQIKTIRDLWREFCGADDEFRIGRWMEKHFHVSHVRFLDNVKAGKVIAVLIKMTRSAEKRRSVRVPAR